jgi:hypothetical protein
MAPKTVWASVLGAALCGVGCGASSGPPPNDSWAAARADVGRAEAGGAPAVPQARLHLQLAQEDLQQAKRLMGDDNKRATSLCAVASTEAQLAFSLAKQATLEDQARKAQSDLQNPSAK